MWRVLYPVGIHFGISEIVGGTALYILACSGKGLDAYIQSSVLLSGISGLLTIMPALHFYRKDRAAREAGGLPLAKQQVTCRLLDFVWLLMIGAALSQFGNIIMAFLRLILPSGSYAELFSAVTDGKSLFSLIFWMGILAPLAEESIFRWLVYLRLRDYMKIPYAILISSLMFGAYHGNLQQFIYAFLIGCFLAWFMEMTGSLFAPVILHMGANIWSLVYSKLGLTILEASAAWLMLGIQMVLLFVLISGCRYYRQKWENRNKRF